MSLQIELYNHQDAYPFHHDLWLRLASIALPLCKKVICEDDAPLHLLDALEYSFLNDTQIAEIHDQFMSDPTPTDVITFHHGEIHISLETADRTAQTLGIPYDKEVILYMIHGMLHLGGWTDYESEERAKMHAQQEEILEQVWSEYRTPTGK